MSSNDLTVDCPACGLTVPDDQAADLETRYGPISMCEACHPDVSVLTDVDGGVDRADG